MKDVLSCDKPGGAARSYDLRMSEWGNPAGGDGYSARRANPGELKHLSTREEQKSTEIPQVAVSERGRGQTGGACSPGVVGPRHGMHDARVKRPGMARQRR